MQPLPGYPAEPAVLVTTMTGRELAAGFGPGDAAAAWIRDRARPGPVPPRRPRALAGLVAEFLPRAVYEEQVLAWLLAHGGQAPPGASAVNELVWTADSRREIAAALRTATRGSEQTGWRQVAGELTRRVLRAPGWAADQIGWPAGQVLHHYLRRLAVTPVSEIAARHAAAVLTLDITRPAADPVLARCQQAAAGQASARIWPERAQAGRPATEQDQRMADLYARYGPQADRPDSVAARMRITGPRP